MKEKQVKNSKVSYEKLIKIGVYTFLGLLAVVMLFPLYWMFASSFMPNEAITKLPLKFFPSPFTLSNYSNIVKNADFANWFLNSLTIATLQTLFVLFTSSTAGYAFAKKEFLGKNILFIMFISAMMIPSQIITIPLFLEIRKFGMVNTFAGVILPSAVAPFGIFMLRQFISNISDDYLEAAKIDGASQWAVFTKIILPLSKPTLFVLGLFTFTTAWNSFLWPLIVLSSPTKFTLQIGLSFLQEQYVKDYGLLMAGAALSALPIIIVFFTFQRHFVRGLAVGGVKG